MSFELEFLEMMPHWIEVRHSLGFDYEGTPVYDPEIHYYQCRIVGKGLSLRRAQGEDDTVIYDIYVNGGGDRFTNQDQITLPVDQAWVDRTPLIFAIGRYTDDTGHHHVKVQCGWMYHRQGQ